MTDVNIAVVLKDAYDDAFDTAMVLSANSDLVAPVVAVRQRFPGKRLVVACPPARQSKRLEATAPARGFLVIHLPLKGVSSPLASDSGGMAPVERQ